MQLVTVSYSQFCYVFHSALNRRGRSVHGTRARRDFSEAELSPPTADWRRPDDISLARFSLQNAIPHPGTTSRDASCHYRHSARRFYLIENRGDRWKSVGFHHQTVPLYESLQFCNLSVSKYFSLDFHCMRSFVRNSVWIVKWCLYTIDSPISGRNHVGLQSTSGIVYNWRAGRGPNHWRIDSGYRC